MTGATTALVAIFGLMAAIEVEQPGSSVEIALPTRGARRLAGRIVG